ncbi:MAG: twin-arginine translocase TatA/TatE family subunit [Pseudomonadota bacterium]
MGLSVWQIAIIAVVILVLFGRGRISEMMGDFGKGISSFKKGMNEDVEEETPASNAQIEAKPADPPASSSEKTKTGDSTASQ